MGMNLSVLSMMGIVALTGVVVNDSLVMVDFINRYRKEGNTIKQAVLKLGLGGFGLSSLPPLKLL